MSKKRGLINYPLPTYKELGCKDKEIKRLNKEFENQIKKDDLSSYCPPEKMYRLKTAYENHSLAALYYWLENSPIEFNTGSDEAILFLHYKHLHTRYYKGPYTNECTDIANFVYMALPDLSEQEYYDIGIKDKRFITKKNSLAQLIYGSYKVLKEDVSNLRKKYSRTLGNQTYSLEISPFLTYEYWLAIYRHNTFDMIFNSSKENNELKTLYEEWFESIIKKIINHKRLPEFEIWDIYRDFYDGKFYGKYEGKLETNNRIVEVYSGESGYKIAYRIKDLKTIYSGDKGTKVAYRIDGNKIYAGKSGTKIVYHIDNSNFFYIYAGETDTKIAFNLDIDNKKIYNNKNKVIYRLEQKIYI